MPEFILNTEAAKPDYFALSDFAKGFIEAAFFSESSPAYNSDEWFGDECQEAISEGSADGNIPGDSDVGDIDPASLASVAAFCAEFQGRAADLLTAAYARDDYDEEQAGRDLYFTYAGHGVGYWDRDALKAPLPDYEAAARAAGWRCVDDEPGLKGWAEFPWRPIDCAANKSEFQRTARDVCELEGIEPDDSAAERYEALTDELRGASQSGDNAAWQAAFDKRAALPQSLGDKLSEAAGRGEINLFANEDEAAESGFVVTFEGI